MRVLFELLTKEEKEQIHDAGIEVLAQVGMKIESEKMLKGLKKQGG